jgi:hypothetical protein
VDKSSDALKYISELVLAHLDSRDPVGGQSWKDIYPLEDAEYDVGRKHRLISHVIRNENARERIDVLRDNVLDLLGFAYILYWKVDHLVEE